LILTVSKKRKPANCGISRREFLRDAGLILGGTAVGSVTFNSSCPRLSQETPTTTLSTDAIVSSVPSTENSLNIITLKVNGQEQTLAVKPAWTLDFVLREGLGLFGTKIGCGTGECGSCTVLSDGKAVFACLMLAVECQGLSLETIEGLSDGLALDPLQQKFYDHEAFQCGFCTPGFIMAAKGLLNANPRPTSIEVREALSGHICTCGNFAKTVEAIIGGV
jgi:aerobic-type carbon monoxide dehydrogenase small subunit (CoxS/CutS family)